MEIGKRAVSNGTRADGWRQNQIAWTHRGCTGVLINAFLGGVYS